MQEEEDRLKDKVNLNVDKQKKGQTKGQRAPEERETDVWGDASKERAFDTDVEGFDNIQKERRWGDGIRGKATGRRATEEQREAKTHKMVQDNRRTDMGQVDG